MIAGLVLAGGRSTRFGSEKAVARVEGLPMIAHVVAVLRQGCAAVAVNAPPGGGAAGHAAAHGLPRLSDPPGAPEGPLAGVLAGLAWAASIGAEALATAPCDTPHLPGDLVARLAAARPCAVARTELGLHPLCALWPVSALPALQAALAHGHPPVRAMLAGLGAVEVGFEDAAAFANINAPADLGRR